VLAALTKSIILYPVLDWKTRAVYGSGIVYGKVIGYKPDGSEIFQPVKDPVLREFFRRSNLPRFGFEGLQGLLHFGQAFAELILSNDRRQITSVTIQDTPFCRYATQQAGQAVPPWVYISAGWPAAQPGDGYTEQVPTLDPYYNAIDDLRADKRGFKYIWPLSLPSPGNALYQVPAWSVILKSRWFDVALAVPEFKKQLFDNQLSIKYLIEVAKARAPVASGTSQAQGFTRAGQQGGAVATAPSAGATAGAGVPIWLLGIGFLGLLISGIRHLVPRQLSRWLK